MCTFLTLLFLSIYLESLCEDQPVESLPLHESVEFFKFIASTTCMSFINNKCSSSKFTSNNIPTNSTKYSKKEQNWVLGWRAQCVVNCILEINYEKKKHKKCKLQDSTRPQKIKASSSLQLKFQESTYMAAISCLTSL